MRKTLNILFLMILCFCFIGCKETFDLTVYGEDPLHPIFTKTFRGTSPEPFLLAGFQVYKTSDRGNIVEDKMWTLRCEKRIKVESIIYGQVPNGCKEDAPAKTLELLEPGQLYDAIGYFEEGTDGFVVFYMYELEDKIKLAFTNRPTPEEWHIGLRNISKEKLLDWEKEFLKMEGNGILEFDKAVINVPASEPAG